MMSGIFTTIYSVVGGTTTIQLLRSLPLNYLHVKRLNSSLKIVFQKPTNIHILLVGVVMEHGLPYMNGILKQINTFQKVLGLQEFQFLNGLNHLFHCVKELKRVVAT